ncbi:MAG: RHS repeat-associated core domain-containing protein [Planctomycetota bacterium]
MSHPHRRLCLAPIIGPLLLQRQAKNPIISSLSVIAELGRPASLNLPRPKYHISDPGAGFPCGLNGRKTPARAVPDSLGDILNPQSQIQNCPARWYEQQTGRLNGMDPFVGNNHDPQSLHKYLYCHANPANSIDPSGKFWSIRTTAK